MFIDGRTLPDNHVLDADLCIVGTGAAGLSLLHGLAGHGLRILLLESGGQTWEPAPDALNAGTSDAPDYPFQTSRARTFGGTTTRWTGACIPLDALDFQPRPWLAHSGWPISLADLAPFYQRATSIFGLPDTLPAPPQDGPFGSGGRLAQKSVFFSNPLDLGQKFRRSVQDSPDVRCVLHATVAELATQEDGQSVRLLRLALPGGKQASVAARFFVLAAGGIENPRLLLNSRDRHPSGLGNRHDTVGRYHMEHPIRCLGTLDLQTDRAGALPFTNRQTLGATACEQTFGLSAKVRDSERLLDMHVRLYRYAPVEAHPAVVAGKELARSPNLRAAARFLRQQGRHLPLTLAPYLGWHALNKVWKHAPFGAVRLTAFLEQEPDPENRIRLSAARDSFGLPLPHMELRESAMMQESISRSLQIMERDFAHRGVGRLVVGSAEVAHLAHYGKYGFHHMGATRMSGDPRSGVVDRNLCVHGVHNLFVSGSSVFCTGGAANPTFTIAALSLRLADHLLQRMRTQ
jgi:choline dehydrogenase-like flavoprotein